MKASILSVVLFVALGLLACGMVAIARPFPEALGLFMAYCLGGLAVIVLKPKAVS